MFKSKNSSSSLTMSKICDNNNNVDADRSTLINNKHLDLSNKDDNLKNDLSSSKSWTYRNGFNDNKTNNNDPNIDSIDNLNNPKEIKHDKHGFHVDI
ncbi:hypothetical protein DERP_000580 [Dermatophagoides pteronyssinus]|uniref:Uncharacterized protein n=1 Tax=Dermatophagoides pteronyssinus TaxID=6956 RepID=A0ABQ8J0K4_DERPT|nr:hypothetical protein DERP_000580 [Dermatophagoides pteronyssinus]